MTINYALHDHQPKPFTTTRDRFIRTAMWNWHAAACSTVSDAFDRLAAALPPHLAITMYQNSPSGSRTEYALVVHRGPAADQRRYFRPDAVITQWSWDVKRGNRIPYTQVVDALDAMTTIVTALRQDGKSQRKEG